MESPVSQQDISIYLVREESVSDRVGQTDIGQGEEAATAEILVMDASKCVQKPSDFAGEAKKPEKDRLLTEEMIGEFFRRRYNHIRPYSKLGYQKPRSLYETTHPIPSSGRPPASLCRGWTNPKIQPKPTNQPLGLTLPVARKGESGRFTRSGFPADAFTVFKNH